ncbi:MAG: hypothetical protein DRO00_08745 [Thermoproteota archaeon]|nr:MAG: hypothetical protein DRO00_08745 [Candidatus Korarchaeota archaeon]
MELQEKAIDVLKALKEKGMSLAVTTLKRRRSIVEQEMHYPRVKKFLISLLPAKISDFSRES